MLHLLAGAMAVRWLNARPALAATAPIAPPAGTMTYRRTMVRHLVGGAQIEVWREFAVRFIRTAAGFVIEGEQVAVGVTMPPELHEFAALERSRIEQGLFPIGLDSLGLIVTPGSAPPAHAAVEQAFNAARLAITRQPLPETERALLRDYIASVHQAGAIVFASLPVDLFAPVEPERRESADIPLPDGEVGRVATTFLAERHPVTGLMRRASREVITEIADDRRHTQESWELAGH